VFNVGPYEFVVLAIVGLIVLGPDKLPELARDAARMIRTLRELASGARTQLREELGPEFADVDLRSFNPRTAIQRAILGEEGLGIGALGKTLDPRQDIKDAVSLGDSNPISLAKSAPEAQTPAVQRPLARGEQAPFDADAT
jgi:sec-independent protein translocase protein TatB